MASQSNPLVSIIIPVFNGERYLEETIESAISQTYPATEIILVDDGSIDRTRQISDRFANNVTCMYQSNQGTAAARNAGIVMANGDYFTFLDADDLWLPEKLGLQMTVMLEARELDLVSCYMKQFVSPDLTKEERVSVLIPQDDSQGFLPTTIVVKRSSFKRVGLFDVKWTVGEFVDWHLRAREIGLISRTIPQVLAKRRIHTTNKGIRLRAHNSERAQILKASLDRRRQVRRNEEE